MNDVNIKKLVVVGGGTAGWLVACILASRFVTNQSGLEITVIESDAIPALGVGEGTWPSMRGTLKKIGISEKEFMSCCNASFKQGSKFVNWQGKGEEYYHPFQLPIIRNIDEIYEYFGSDSKSFAQVVCPQISLDAKHQAPKLLTTDDYATIVNYGYHLDAGKFGELLREFAVQKYGVIRIVDTILQINVNEEDYITSVRTNNHEQIAADFFVDCSGFSSIIMKQHYKIPFVDCKEILFNDRAIAVQIPYEKDNSEINSYTISTAQRAGWVWDIGLSSRRGVGYTYSSQHSTEEQAIEELVRYVDKTTVKNNTNLLSFKKIQFNPGYLKKFWHKNCVAIGVSSGFIEPLEASALVMIELSANMLADNFPSSYDGMAVIEKKYNERFSHHWRHIIEFLKLHYILSEKTDSEYWIENRAKHTVPENLQEKMSFWQYHPPSQYDDVYIQELFPVASYQYVLYGMGYKPYSKPFKYRSKDMKQINLLDDALRISQQLEKNMPTNRTLLDALKIV